MEVKFEIPDDKVVDFSGNAKNKIVEQAKEYTLEVISEAEKIEWALHEDDASTEITSGIVTQAARKFRSPSRNKNQKLLKTIISIVAEFLLFIAGLIFIPEWFMTKEHTLNIVFLVLYLILFAAALGATIVSHFIEGD